MHAASETMCNRVLLSCTPLCGGTSQLPIHVCGKQICESRSLLSFEKCETMAEELATKLGQMKLDINEKYSTNRHTQQGTLRIPRNKQQVTRQRFFPSISSLCFRLFSSRDCRCCCAFSSLRYGLSRFRLHSLLFFLKNFKYILLLGFLSLYTELCVVKWTSQMECEIFHVSFVFFLRWLRRQRCKVVSDSMLKRFASKRERERKKQNKMTTIWVITRHTDSYERHSTDSHTNFLYVLCFWMCTIAADWLWKCISVDCRWSVKDKRRQEVAHKRKILSSVRSVCALNDHWMALTLLANEPMIVLDIEAKNAQSKANNNVLNGNSKNYSRVSRNL